MGSKEGIYACRVFITRPLECPLDHPSCMIDTYGNGLTLSSFSRWPSLLSSEYSLAMPGNVLLCLRPSQLGRLSANVSLHWSPLSTLQTAVCSPARVY